MSSAYRLYLSSMVFLWNTDSGNGPVLILLPACGILFDKFVKPLCDDVVCLDLLKLVILHLFDILGKPALF